MSRSSG
jgi:hypothetical protein